MKKGFYFLRITGEKNEGKIMFVNTEFRFFGCYVPYKSTYIDTHTELLYLLEYLILYQPSQMYEEFGNV